MKKIAGPLVALAVILLLLITFLGSGCGFKSIPPGSVGVKFNGASGVSTHLLRPEVVWVGWNEQLIIYPTNIQQATFVRNAQEGDKKKDDSIEAATSEGAVLPVDVTVSYRIPGDSESITKVFNTFGVPSDDPEHPLHHIQKTFIRWAAVVAVNDVSSRSSIFDLISKGRAQFGPDVKAVLGPLLESWGLKLEDVMIREIHPPQEIVDKITEQQQMRAELQRITILKQQAVTEAQTTIIEAQKVAEQNRLLAQQGQQALALKKLERRKTFIERWDGHSGLVGSGPIPQF
jgi:regulator of protease activity HflC (stomatin/prohibitin superfamily)